MDKNDHLGAVEPGTETNVDDGLYWINPRGELMRLRDGKIEKMTLEIGNTPMIEYDSEGCYLERIDP